MYGAIAQFPIAGFPLPDSLSVADPLPSLLADPNAEREFLLRAYPRDAGGFVIPVELSSGGYAGSLTPDTYHHQFDAKDVAYTDNANGYRITLNNGSAPNIAYRGANDFDGYVVGADIVISGNSSQPGVYLIIAVDPSGLWVQVAEPLQTATDVGLIVSISYSSVKLFRSAIARPYNFTTSLSAPDFRGGASSGVGEVRINNGDALMDEDALLDWLGAQSDVYLGRKGAPLADFTRILKGVSAGLTWGLDTLSIINRDTRFRLQQPLLRDSFAGLGACVRLNGSDHYGNTTHACPANSMSMELLATPNATPAAQQVLMSYRNGAGVAGVRNLIFGIDATGSASSGNVVFQVRNDAGTLFNVAAGTGRVSGGVRAHIAGVLDSASLLIHIYVDSVLRGTAAVTGTFATTISNLDIGRAGGSAASFYPGKLDEIRTWSATRNADDFAQYMNRELLGTEPNLVYYNKLNDGTTTTATATVGNNIALNGTSPGTTAWASMFEGDASLFGSAKPQGFGKFRQAAPTPVDSQRLVYMVMNGSMQAIDAVRDKGDPLTFNADVADIYASTPASGQYNTCLAKGLIRLGVAPDGQVTVDGRGDNADGYEDTVAGIHRLIATRFGGMTDPDDFDVASYTTLAGLSSAVVGFYFSSSVNVDEVLDIVAASINAWWGINRVGQLMVGRIDAPSSYTPSMLLVQSDLVEPKFGGTFRRDPVGVRVGEVILHYRRYQTVMDPNQVAGIAIGQADDFGKEYRVVRAVDDERTDDADTVELFTEIDDPVEARAEAERWLALFKVDRCIYTVTMGNGILSYFIGTATSLTYNRYDLTLGKQFVIVGLEEDMGEFGAADRLQISLFG